MHLQDPVRDRRSSGRSWLAAMKAAPDCHFDRPACPVTSTDSGWGHALLPGMRFPPAGDAQILHVMRHPLAGGVAAPTEVDPALPRDADASLRSAGASTSCEPLPAGRGDDHHRWVDTLRRPARPILDL